MSDIVKDKKFHVYNIDNSLSTLQTDKMFELLFKIFASIVFEHFAQEDWPCTKLYSIGIANLTLNHVTIVSIRLNGPDVAPGFVNYYEKYFEGAIDNTTGMLIEPFKEVISEFRDKSCVDEKHNKIITYNAVYNSEGRVLCSGLINIIALDLTEGYYVLLKMQDNIDYHHEVPILFNANNNSEIELEIGEWSIDFAEFYPKYILIRVKQRQMFLGNYEDYFMVSYDETYGDDFENDFEEPCELKFFYKDILIDYTGNILFDSRLGAICIFDNYIFVRNNEEYKVYSLSDFQYLYTLELEPFLTGQLLKDKLHESTHDGKHKIIKAFVNKGDKKKYGYVTFPLVKIPFKYEDVSSNFTSYAIVKQKGRYGLIDEAGDEIIKPTYDYLFEPYKYGNDILLSNNGGKVNEGKEIIGGLWGAVKTTGEILFEPYYDKIWIHNQYIFVVKEYKIGLINTKGNTILDVVYDEILPPSENMIAIKISQKQLSKIGKIQYYGYRDESLWGFTDLNGEIKIKPTFEEVRRFSAGRAAYKQDGRYGFIDINGERITPPLYSDVKNFDVVEQKAKVYIGKYYNYVNLNGELLADWLPDSGNARSHFNDDYNEEQHYTRYNGTYAQAYEGWSDEEIDEAFDGNPEAYWNID